MIKCPNCGSTAQPKELDTEYFEDGWTIEVQRHYKCGCGAYFVELSWYHSDGCTEVHEE